MRRIELALEIFKSREYLNYLHPHITDIAIASSESNVYFTFSDGQQCIVNIDNQSVRFAKNEAYHAVNH